MNVIGLLSAERREVRDTFDDRGFDVSAIGSPIGKVAVTGSFELHLEQFEHCLDVAAAFDAEYVRLFSGHLPERERSPTEEVLFGDFAQQILLNFDGYVTVRMSGE